MVNNKDPDRQRGCYSKWYASRIGDVDGKHKYCELFVLDFNHDKFSIPAAKAYAEACRAEYPMLAEDIMKRVAIAETIHG